MARIMFIRRRLQSMIIAGFLSSVAAYAPSASAQQPATSPPTGVGAIASDPARDAVLRDFLRKRFKIANPDAIKVGPMFPTKLPGLYARQVTVTNDKGEAGSSLLFVDKDQTTGIVAQAILDLTSDPWMRADMSKVHLNDRPSMGAADAPVTIVEFADFECPHCAHASSELEAMVSTTYKGKVRMLFKYFPLNGHPWALSAAQASECARLQNPAMFWDYARYFFTNQGSITPANVDDNIGKITSKSGLDLTSLKACMTTAGATRVNEDRADGEILRVNSTPTLFVNGIPVAGLLEGKGMNYIIDSELAPVAASSPAK
jgi:protein-disulfide isomerase